MPGPDDVTSLTEDDACSQEAFAQTKKTERAPRLPGQAYDPKVWAEVYQDYRTGQWSLHALARRHAVSEAGIRIKAKQQGWRKDLAPEIRGEVKRGLGAFGLHDPSHATDAQIVENATRIGLAVIRGHQSHLSRLKATSMAIVERLHAIVNGQYGEATEYFPVRTREGKVVHCPVLGTRESLADALLKVANATARFIPLERQAWNLNEQGEDEPYEERLRKFYEEAAKKRREFASDRNQLKH